jgi:hypothetical protein
MNSLIKEKWVAALRSGKYKQTSEVLYDYEGFCCLGVLCDIYSKEKGVEWEHSDKNNLPAIFDCSYIPPTQVCEWAEIDGYLTNVVSCGVTQSLHGLNDLQEWDFNQIADVIERDF